MEVWGRLKAALRHVNCFIPNLLFSCFPSYWMFQVLLSWTEIWHKLCNIYLSLPQSSFPVELLLLYSEILSQKNLPLWCFSDMKLALYPFPFNFWWQFLAAIRILPTHIPAIQQSLIGSLLLLPEIPHRGWRKPCFPQLR